MASEEIYFVSFSAPDLYQPFFVVFFDRSFFSLEIYMMICDCEITLSWLNEKKRHERENDEARGTREPHHALRY